MKLLPFVVSTLAVTALTAAAAIAAEPTRTSGVYVTAADYTEHRLSLEGDCQSSSHKLELHDVLHKTHIDVTHGAETRKYAKHDLFGFKACDGGDYRFVSDREYRILEARQLYIYTVEEPARLGKDTAMDRETVTTRYFSVGAAGAVQRLTLDNVKRAFPTNHAFHDSLDQMVGAGQGLAQYDDFHKMFKINRLLIASSSSEREEPEQG